MPAESTSASGEYECQRRVRVPAESTRASGEYECQRRVRVPAESTSASEYKMPSELQENPG